MTQKFNEPRTQWSRLAGAAQGLRWRFGLQAWPMLRRNEAELVAQVRRTLGGEQFDQAFAEGSALSQREAVAAARTGPTAAVLPAAGNRLARLPSDAPIFVKLSADVGAGEWPVEVAGEVALDAAV